MKFVRVKHFREHVVLKCYARLTGRTVRWFCCVFNSFSTMTFVRILDTLRSSTRDLQVPLYLETT